MPHLCRLLGLVLLTACAAAMPLHAQTRPTPAPATPQASALTQTDAQRTLDLLQNDQRRAELIATLEAIAKAAPAVPVTPATTPTTTPAATPATTPAPAPAKPASVPAIAPDSLGVQVVHRVTVGVRQAGTQLLASVQAVNDLPLLWRWLDSQGHDPVARAQMKDAAWKLAVVFGCALAAEWLVRRVFRGIRQTLARWSPHAADPELPPESGEAAAEAGEFEHNDRHHRLSRALGALRRLPFLFGRLLLDLLPIAVFFLVGDLLLGTRLGTPDKTRLVVTEALQAYAAARAILACAAFLISPVSPRARLLHVSDWAAAFLMRVVRRTVIVAVVAIATTNMGLLFGMYQTAHDAVLKLFALVVHAGFVVAVLQARRPVAARLRARSNRHGLWASMLNRFAEIWHLVAIFYIVALWFVWAIEVRDGWVRLLDFGALTAAVLFVARLLSLILLGGLDRLRVGWGEGSDQNALERRAGHYFPMLRRGLTVLLWCLTGVALLEVWGFQPVAWFASGGLGGRILSAILVIGLISLVAFAVWEASNAAIERHLADLSDSAQLARAGRLRTLLPLLRSVLLITIVLVVALMALSELGVNVAPLLAGAGVVGIAVGFGSQKLVQDLITGLFLLLENAMQVGDVVTVAALTGTVEALSIRTIRLRALDGAVHLIPFSSVTTVTNQTRDYSYALVDVSIGLNEAPDRITQVLRTVAEEMRADTAWSSMVLDKLDVMGVEKLTDLAWIMRVRIKTQPGSRWAVARELNRRIKVRFDEQAIESPFTSHRVLGREPPPPPVPVAEEQAA